MVTDNVDLDIDGIAGDGERAIAGAHSTEASHRSRPSSSASAPR